MTLILVFIGIVLFILVLDALAIWDLKRKGMWR
jgi:hypothetical protein